MLHRIRGFIAVAGLVTLGIAAAVSQASAFNLRIPQVPVLGGSLQAYLNSKGESINVLTDQVDAQIWSSSASGHSVLTLMVELAGNAPSNTIGMYNVNNGLTFQVFPGAAAAGWHAMISFQAGGILVVTLFDANSIIIGQTVYGGVDPNAFGFYISGPGGTYFSQDVRNGGNAQMLTYAGTGVNFGEWWFCFEDTGVAAGSDQDFDDAVIILESVTPLGTRATTLGGVKALYR